MNLQKVVVELAEQIKENKKTITVNKDLFEVFEGDLCSKVIDEIRHSQNFTHDTAYDAISRLSPINMVVRIVDKLSSIYSDAPKRIVIDGTDSDAELVEWYAEQMNLDTVMGQANEFYNLFKNTLLEPYVQDGSPYLRVIPSHQFWVHSEKRDRPTDPTHVLTFQQDAIRSDSGEVADEFYAYSDEEFGVIDSKGNINADRMAELENPGVNPFGALPFVYLNQSANLLIPLPDVDLLEMGKLIPILLTDLNYAVKYQSFSSVYSIDVDVGRGMSKAPNAWLDLKSKIPGEGNPSVGTIKPEVDIPEVLNLIASQFSMFLNSRGIRPGSIGDATAENFASGISKLIDEMDIFEHRKKQINAFAHAESQLWELMLKKMHPIWVQSRMIENKPLFSPNAKVITEFPSSGPMLRKGDMIRELKEEIEAGFSTKRRAIQKLNPRMTEEEVDDLIREIDEEKRFTPLAVSDGTAENED